MGAGTIRVVERAVAVIRALDGTAGLSLAELKACTGLPKATLSRLLATLEAQAVVWRALGDGRYRNRVSFRPITPAQHLHSRLAEAAAPHLEALQRKVVWPSDLTVRHRYWMELVETSRARSGLALNRDRLGHRIDMLLSAVGRAYLAFCPDEEREEILGRLRAHPEDRVNPGRFNLSAVRRTLAETRKRSYGTRDPSFGGSAKSIREVDDKLAAIAVPITSARRVLGCINIVWPRRLMREREVARRHLTDLARTAERIARAAEEAGIATSRRKEPAGASGQRSIQRFAAAAKGGADRVVTEGVGHDGILVETSRASAAQTLPE